VELRYQRIAKGRFDELAAQTRDAIWPWEEKLGARPIGQWKVIYPNAPNRTVESPAFDEVVTLTRYASDAHRRAMAPDRAVLLGGNGPDWRAWRAALDAQAPLILETSSELLRGEMYNSPPVYTPSLGERYRIKAGGSAPGLGGSKAAVVVVGSTRSRVSAMPSARPMVNTAARGR
jgi:hypothetical protein